MLISLWKFTPQKNPVQFSGPKVQFSGPERPPKWSGLRLVQSGPDYPDLDQFRLPDPSGAGPDGPDTRLESGPDAPKRVWTTTSESPRPGAVVSAGFLLYRNVTAKSCAHRARANQQHKQVEQPLS